MMIDVLRADIKGSRDACSAVRAFMNDGVIEDDLGGSPPISDLVYLDLLCEQIKPVNAIEVGTWIGVSSEIIARHAERLWTCDFRNRYRGRADNIVFECGHSNDLLPLWCKMDWIEFAFIDARLSGDDFKNLVGAFRGKVAIAVHDYYGPASDVGQSNCEKLLAVDSGLELVEPMAKKINGVIVDEWIALVRSENV